MEFYLKNGHMQAVVRTKGGELISLKDGEGREYLWDGNPKYWFGINPILFPIVGGLQDGKIRIGEEICEMNRHGFARDQEFQMVEQREDSILLELVDNEETWKQYPRHFRLRVLHQLESEGFSTTMEVTNTGECELPFCMGGHTAFRCPMKEGECFEDYELVFDEEEPTWNHFSLSYDVFEKLDTIILRDLRSEGVCLRHKTGGHGIRVEYAGFPLLALWTKGELKAPFLCIEPWHGCGACEGESGEFREKEECICLQPKENIALKYIVKVLTKS